MWADNETSVDLLGFDYLVDSLELVLTDDRLLPVTVGILGDWGSGKSSLLQMVAERLGKSPGYVVVPFSPWRYQAYDDVKAALMDAVLTGLAPYIPPADTARSGVLRRLRQKVARMAGSKFSVSLMSALGTIAAAREGVPAEVGSAVANALVAEVGTSQPPDHSEPPAPTASDFESVSAFREEFEALLNGMDAVKAVIVLIDDLDRCLDDTVVDVFEAIRLFLQVSSTAFVIAANRDIVQAAVERRYPTSREGEISIGKDYLEKIIQVEITVPPLSEAEAETFLNLLFASLRLDAQQMSQILEAAAARRREGQFGVAMNYGIARGVLGTVSDGLEGDFVIANRVSPTLTRGLRGNPRQLKRFLNTMLLRLETARRRGVELDPAVLAKLMILEQTSPHFQQLFFWQLTQSGTPEEVVVCERAMELGLELPSNGSGELKAWFASPLVKSWLELEPRLAGRPLGEYFFFSRDRLSSAAPEARLSSALQTLLSRLQLSTLAVRRTAVEAAAKLGPEEFAGIYDALLAKARRRPDSEAMSSALELAQIAPSNWHTAANMLVEIPPNDVPPALPVRLALLARGQHDVRPLLDRWETDGPAALKRAVAEAKRGAG